MVVEMRDPYTAGHERRVAELACAVAQEMGLAGEQITPIRLAASVHDSGKVSVPAEVLTKPRRLSDIEYELIRRHSQVGYEVLSTIDFPWPIARIVLQHHERVDGSGYPAGIAGDEIALEARIIGVPDVVEAMATYRPYRPALGIDAAIAGISQNSGVLYDESVVKACVRVIMERGFRFS